MPQLPILVFDFDGTVALGHGPVRAYARQIATALGDSRGGELLTELDEYLAGARHDEIPLDGYDLVRILATRAGADTATMSAAYLASRHVLGLPDAPVTAPDGLAELLDDVRGRARRALVTNAPSIRIVDTLAALGLADSFDQIITSAGKPAGFGALLDELTADVASPRLLSIGDVWANDLAPAHARGFDTALVGPHVPTGATPTFRSDQLPALYPAISAWVSTGSLTGSTSSIDENTSTSIPITTH